MQPVAGRSWWLDSQGLDSETMASRCHGFDSHMDRFLKNILIFHFLLISVGFVRVPCMTFDLPGGAAISSEDIFYNLSACVSYS